MKQLLNFIGSMKSMAVMMLIFAVAIGYATIVENDFGTMSAKAEIYNARWFEVLLGLLAINLIINIFRYKMYTRKKLPVFLFHVGFLVVLVGAAITRYVGYEGTMHIREGMQSNTMVSAKTYLQVHATTVDSKKASYEKPLYLSVRKKNDVEAMLHVGDKDVEVELLEYISDAVETIVDDAQHGKPIAKFMLTSPNMGANQITLSQGEAIDAGSFVVNFGSKHTSTKPTIELSVENGKLIMSHEQTFSYFRMDDGTKGELEASAAEVVEPRVLYSMKDGSSFVLRDFKLHGVKKLVSSALMGVNKKMRMKIGGVDVLRFGVRVGDKAKELIVYGRAGDEAKFYSVFVNGVNVAIGYGAKEITLPFALKLKDFQLDRYPGSMSPASYASVVEVIDPKDGVDFEFRIYMNHILDYKNFRFFQSSYDQDEKGTILSVNHDPGTLPSYIGYFLLAVGMFWSLFSKKLRFAQLSKRAKDAAKAKALSLVMVAFALGMGHDLYAGDITKIDQQHADKFGRLVVQDTQGRMKPLDTLATEVLAKIHRSATLDVNGTQLDQNQVVLGMMIRPDQYMNVPLIRTGDPKVNAIIGVDKDTKYVSFAQFFQDPQAMQGYKLAQTVDQASRKAPKDRNKLDKKALAIDEKVNIVYMVFTGSLFKIWPIQNDPNNKWLSTIDALQTLPEKQAQKVRDLALTFFSSVDSGLKTGSWEKSDSALAQIIAYQKKYGSAVYPPEGKLKAEIFYNHSNIFEMLWPLYFIVGFVLLVLSFVKIIKPEFQMQKVTKISLGLLALFFVAHTVGLGLRWYISGHAPWSNGFESMTYIAWATVLAGFIFSKQSPITLASTSILTGLILFVAHLNWMNPQITNLVPVLNSYWLSIHVSLITASYGFLGLGALLGFITLLLYIFAKGANQERIALSIKELNAINEMSLMIGLALLTVGNFLGGVWANESWGRYWGWDPKETWALVTILVYAVVVHIRFIKSIYTEFNYSVISLLAFTSVLMTYFGVNYYLAGMHSYAKGDPVPIPDFVPVSYAVIFIVIALAYRNRKIA